MMATTTMPMQADRNYEAFQRLLPELMSTQPGKYAVLHNGEVIEFFDTMSDAAKFGRAQFEGDFSVQQVTSRSVNLGYHSYAIHHLSA
jgi:hypothetical protein